MPPSLIQSLPARSHPREPSASPPTSAPRPTRRAYWSTIILPTAGTFLVLAAAVTWTAYGNRYAPRVGSAVVFAIGALITLLISTLVFHAFRGQARRDAQDLSHLRALEKLNEIAIAISSRIDSPPDVLKQLAAAARELLAMDRSGVALLDSATHSLKVVATAGDIPRDAPIKFPLAQLPLCSRLLDSGEQVLVEDVAKLPTELNAEVVDTFHATAMILIPLSVGERKLGLLALSSSRPRHFSPGDRRLARLLGSQAAVILGNSELYARMGDALRTQQRLF